MEFLSEEVWDVVIAGTSLPQALLALALSRSDKKVLHLDRNGYYGGNDAGLSLQDASAWVAEHSKDGGSTFSNPHISVSSTPTENQDVPQLGPSRAYTLSLNPQIIYAQSEFLPALVSSQIHNQLEFLAVGSWWILRNGGLQKIPSSREDVFNDDTLSIKDKRGLMKFLRYMLQDEENEDSPQEEVSGSLQSVLSSKFNMSKSLQLPILALALSMQSSEETDFQSALARIRKHMRSIGYFGPGFGAVVAKYGGSAEIAQVACRAGAVGGGVYLLGHGVQSIDPEVNNNVETDESSGKDDNLTKVTLPDGIVVKARCVVGGVDDIPRPETVGISQKNQLIPTFLNSISIVSNPLSHLFPQTSDNGPVPAVAIAVVAEEETESTAPVYLQIHSEDTSECPSGQCIIYGTTQLIDESSKARLKAAVEGILSTCNAESNANVLWSMSYNTSKVDTTDMQEAWSKQSSGRVVFSESRAHDIALNDEILKNVKIIWEKILGEEAEGQTFLRFPERETETSDPFGS